MHVLRKLSEKYPVLFSIVVVVLATMATEISFRDLLTPFLGERYADYIPGMLEQYITTLAVALLSAGIGLRGMATFRPPASWKAVLFGWPLILLAVLNGSDLFTGAIHPASNWVLPVVLVLLYLSTGFLEEGLFRGLMMGLFLRRWGGTARGIRGAALLSSVLFALTHVVNLVQGRYTALAAVTQIIFAVFFGVFFAALAIRTGSLLPGVLLHALFDFAGNLSALEAGALPRAQTVVSRTPMDALIAIAITAPLFLYGLFLLRKAAVTPPAMDVPPENA